MTKKILCWCLVLLFVFPLPANANMADDVKQFKQKYADIYQKIDPSLTQKMEIFLEDVVNYVVANHTTTTSIDVQIKNAIGSTLLTGDKYKNDLLPFLLDQAENKDIYASQLTEMQGIVRREAENRLNAQTPKTPGDSGSSGSGSGGGGTSSTAPLSSADVEINSQISQGKLTITVIIKKGQESLDISGASLQKIITSGNTLKIKGTDITVTMKGNALNLQANDVWRVQMKHILPQQSDSLIQNLPLGNRIIGPVHELNSIINDNPMQTTFAKPIEIEIHYDKSQLQGVTEDSLDVYYYNESIGKWEKMNGAVDKANKTITLTTTHFSKYAIMTNAEEKDETKVEPEPTTGAEKFTDLTGHWAAAEIGSAVKLGIASGMSATRFAPDQNITRAQFATLLTRAIGLKSAVSIQSRFNDVTADAWYYDAVNSAAEAGLVSGYSPTTFGPNDLITREQMAVMISNALAYKNKQVNNDASVLEKFKDRGEVSSWAISGVSTAVQKGIITGRSVDTIAPRSNATRAEGTAMILRMYKLL